MYRKNILKKIHLQSEARDYQLYIYIYTHVCVWDFTSFGNQSRFLFLHTIKGQKKSLRNSFQPIMCLASQCLIGVASFFLEQLNLILILTTLYIFLHLISSYLFFQWWGNDFYRKGGKVHELLFTKGLSFNII